MLNRKSVTAFEVDGDHPGFFSVPNKQRRNETMDRFDLVTFVVQIFLGPFNLAKILSLRSKIGLLGLFSNIIKSLK